MKFTCHATDKGKVLRELPSMEEPDRKRFELSSDYMFAHKRYESHLSTLKEYTIAPEHEGSFTVGVEYVEGKDFAIDMNCVAAPLEFCKVSIRLRNVKGHATFVGNPSAGQVEAVNALADMAFKELKKIPPLKPQEEKDVDVWEEVEKIIYDVGHFNISPVNAIGQLKSKYTITKK